MDCCWKLWCCRDKRVDFYAICEEKEDTMKKLDTELLLGAYAQGIFPMAQDGQILWFEPHQRGVIPVDSRFHIPKGLRKALKKSPFQIHHNRDFTAVIQACSQREETWIDEEIMSSYSELFEQGFAHSFECWDQEGLQGGLYGVRLGGAFFGESMFSRKSDASKIALVALVQWMRSESMVLLDTQWMTDHLRQFGGYEVPKAEYRVMLGQALS